MQRHMIGTYAGSVTGMESICELLNIGVDPVSSFQEYSEVVGEDLNGAPIEAGLPRATWTWAVMSQTDFQYLLDLLGTGMSANVIIRTRNNSGESGLDFDNYIAVMHRPTCERDEGNPLLCRDVTLQFTALVAL